MKLTISMATHDDYDGVYFTIQSLRLHHDLPPSTEFLILDNNPRSDHGQALLSFSKWVPGARVIPVTDRISSFVKYDAFRLAQGDVILGLDCHVLLQPGFISSMMDYWRTRSDSRDLLTGPLLYNDLKATSVKMEPCWRGHDFGIWGNDPEAMATGVPFEVPMMGMGCFSMRRGAVPILASGFSGFGAEEWYLAEKVRQNGGRVMCHPNLGWNHRFDWPKRRFPLTLQDKVRNYYRGWFDVYQSHDHPMLQTMTEYWLTVMPRHKLEQLMAEAQMTIKPVICSQ
jgi:hypothetical protein